MMAEYCDVWDEGGNKLTDNQIEEMFDDFLDEVYEKTIICGIDYYPSMILRNEPVTYRCMIIDWIDGEICDGRFFDEDPTEGAY